MYAFVLHLCIISFTFHLCDFPKSMFKLLIFPSAYTTFCHGLKILCLEKKYIWR
jgi:hypothetical protein